MGEDAALDIMLLVLVLAIIAPLVIVQSMILNNYGLNAPGTQVEKSMRVADYAGDFNPNGSTRPLEADEILMMIAIADYGMQDPKYLQLGGANDGTGGTGIMLQFDPSMLANRGTHIAVVNNFMLDAMDSCPESWITEFRVRKVFPGLSNNKDWRGIWQLQFQYTAQPDWTVQVTDPIS